ncbi:type II toxin-antitoxin system RelE/ParE family toxin [Gulosibacter molinativorax]
MWIADQGSPEAAERYVMSISDYCASLTDFPRRGTARDDLYPGLRTLGFRRRVTIAYTFSDSEVVIFGVYYGGRDYESLIEGSID